MDELNEAVQVFCRNLSCISIESSVYDRSMTYSIVFLIKVVHVAVQDFDEQLYRHCSIHAGIGDTERALQTLEYSFPIAIKLSTSVKVSVPTWHVYSHSLGPHRPKLESQSPTIDGSPSIRRGTDPAS